MPRRGNLTIIAFIIGCEIAFWVFVLGGLACRYLLRKRRTGAALLLLTPVIDLVLLIATVFHLRDGAEAGFAHGLAAIYIGVSIAFGRSMVRWADERFAYRFAGGPPPRKKPKHGPEHARAERQAWLKHLLAWGIGCLLLYGMIALVGDDSRTKELPQVAQLWSIILLVDFLISFSYTIWPRKSKETV
ncbi:hypothetical protein [Cohnella sp. AR92]|uniref:hypothetical protein n=1 Tax=Cohnella sp. AR92 TaxID=648716 RepID=UPI000F8D1325|nr:hypothetical protein [Cohnella sp. AR92]RUS47275.1 hypothetical protein ELR57_09100 [Cohnella sp. AR92]